MAKTRLTLRRVGSATVVPAVLLAGCGGETSTSDEVTTEQTPGGEPGVATSAGTATPEEADDASGDDSTDTSGDEGGTDENAETFEVTIADGEVSPPFDTHVVAFGAEVRIEVQSDAPDELHLHGYDLELAVGPGEPGVLEFTADIEGRFELEAHDLGRQLLQIEVR